MVDLPCPLVFRSADFRLKKCLYTAFAARISSQEEVEQVLEKIGGQVRDIDVIPFAIRLMKSTVGVGEDRKNGENDIIEEEFREDNGDFGVGDLLADVLWNEGSSNMILV